MQKITFVEVSYTPNGHGKAILIIRGSLMRVYRYTWERAYYVSMACPCDKWVSKFYPQKMTMQPK